MASNTKIQPLLGSTEVNQLAFVVNDIEKASADFSKLLGIANPGWFLTGDEEVSKVIYKGKPTASQSKLAFLNTPTVQFELIEPNMEPGTMREFLNETGEGIHHIAVDVDMIQNHLPNLEKNGYPLLQSGEFTSSDGRYIYVDTANETKTLIELLESAEPRDTTYKAGEEKPLLGTNVVEQLAIVVKDLDRAADKFCQLLGVKKPEVIQSGHSDITKVVYNGEATEADSRYMFIRTPLLEIELIEPGKAPSTWKTHLESFGEGVHHISFVVKDMDEKITLLEEMDYPVIQRGNFYNGKGRYAYMDTTSTFKVIIELLEKY